MLGLSKHLLNVARLETLVAMATRGDLTRVDLTVEDIAGGPVGNLPAGATASNFGKLTADAAADDRARALVNMIAEVIVVLSVIAPRANQHQQVVLTGKLVPVAPLFERIQSTRALFDRGFVVPKFAEVATAIGAARRLRSTP